MSFFEPPPPPPEPPEAAAVPPWHGPPGNELGVAVPIRYLLVRTDDVAILLDGLVAFSTGVELEVTSSRGTGRSRTSFTVCARTSTSAFASPTVARRRASATGRGTKNVGIRC